MINCSDADEIFLENLFVRACLRNWYLVPSYVTLVLVLCYVFSNVNCSALSIYKFTVQIFYST